MKNDPAEAGFTLIELMISLALFALIAVAGLAMVQGILGVQGRTEKRLDRLAEFQRTMIVITSDIEQVAHGRIDGSVEKGLTFTRAAPGLGGQPILVHYELKDGVLLRQTNAMPQMLLSGITQAQFRFFDHGVWTAAWPRNDEEADKWPDAIEIRMQVNTPVGGGPSGTLRRVVTLPAQVDEPTPPALGNTT